VPRLVFSYQAKIRIPSQGNKKHPGPLLLKRVTKMSEKSKQRGGPGRGQGRKPKDPEKGQRVSICVRLPRETIKTLADITAQTGETRTQVVERAIKSLSPA